MVTTYLQNKTRSAFDFSFLEQTVARVLSKYGITDNVDIELQIVGSARMRRLNREHRKKDYPTDVLSFPIWPDLPAIKAQRGKILLGSIVVCLPVAVRDAKEENISLNEKLDFLVDHSLLHLMGFHHDGD